jgi:hypothetical protein
VNLIPQKRSAKPNTIIQVQSPSDLVCRKLKLDP